MKASSILFALIFVSLFSCVQKEVEKPQSQIAFVAPMNNERMRLFDDGWRFSKTENEEAIAPDFDDHTWREINLPHDWSIEDLPEGEGIVGPFSKESPGGVSTGFTIGGIGVYRKAFTVAKEDAGKIFSIYFDGVYMESDVWINGNHLGFHPNGYTPFYYEITDYLNAPGEENVLVVRAKNMGENSRWYSGSGIYRHVWLRVTDRVNIPVWGVFVTTPKVSDKNAMISADIKIDNRTLEAFKATVKNSVYCNDQFTGISSSMDVSLTPENQQTINSTIVFNSPRIWTLDEPSLYVLKTEVLRDGRIVDVVETTFGIRTLDFSPDEGFLLNGEPTILKGGCVHHDNGILGSATYDRAEIRRVENMKANGFNAIRTSHNPPSQQFLDACDRLGVFVMDEAFDRWEHPKKPNDYHRFFREWSKKDIQSMVLRDRNHPSIFAWSYGNEIYERADSSGIRIAKQLISDIKEIDTSRPVTQAICGFWEFKDARPWSDSEPAFELMDIHGYNYKWQEYENDHAQFPERIMVGTESFPMEAYENYQMVVKHPYVIGDFVWTGMDYLGEAGIGQAVLDSVKMAYPWFNGFCGDVSILGFKKPQSFYRDVVWGRSKLEMAVETPAPEGHKWAISAWGWRNELPSWNWSGFENHPMDVYVYSSAERVVLMMNGKQLAEETATDSSQYVFHFKVLYQPGELTAIAYNGDNVLEQKSIKTTGQASQIALLPERETITANSNDLAYVEVNLLDENGLLVMDDDQVIHFSVEGGADIVAAGNGNPTEMKSFQSASCKTYRGRCLVIVRPNGSLGDVTVKASVNQLMGDEKTILIQ